jgi:ribulose-phosphate 3-epimerase
MIKIAPSFLSADLLKLEQQLRACETGGADMLHLDIMDGHFVPNLSYGPGLVKQLRRNTDLLLDCHLMVSRPEDFVIPFIEAGADIVSVHLEATNHPERLLSVIRANGAKAAIALNPATPIESLSYLLPALDMILLMTVNPGYGGQSFIPRVLEKIIAIKELCSSQGFNIPIQIDGGVDEQTVKSCVKAGATILVSGSYLFRQHDLAAGINNLRKMALDIS